MKDVVNCPHMGTSTYFFYIGKAFQSTYLTIEEVMDVSYLI